MKREEIIAKWAELGAREKDAWIESAVFGRETFGQFREANGIRVLIPHYTSYIAEAWAVFERFPYIEVARIPGESVTYGVRINGLDGSIRAMTQEPTFPEAACLAALIASLRSDGTAQNLTEVTANV